MIRSLANIRTLSGILLGIWILFQGEMLVHSWDHCCGHDDHATSHSGSQEKHKSEDCEFCQIFYSPFNAAESIGFGIYFDGYISALKAFLPESRTAEYKDPESSRGPPLF